MSVELKPTSEILSRLHLEEGGEAHKVFTQACAKYMDEFVPMDKGNLRSYRIDGADTIVYNQLYARYQYYGISKSGKELHYSEEKHQNATSYWDEAMVDAHMSEVEQEVQDFIDRGGK